MPLKQSILILSTIWARNWLCSVSWYSTWLSLGVRISGLFLRIFLAYWKSSGEVLADVFLALWIYWCPWCGWLWLAECCMWSLLFTVLMLSLKFTLFLNWFYITLNPLECSPAGMLVSTYCSFRLIGKVLSMIWFSGLCYEIYIKWLVFVGSCLD